VIIGFTHGVFDLLHEGHLHLFAQARERCDYLIVGVNHDDSVRRLKGAPRPIQTIDVRLYAIIERAAPWVDAVIPFDGAKSQLAARLRPHVWFVGYDQATKPELLHLCEDMKCFVVRISELPGRSTSLQLAALSAKTGA
jgi:D-beta-D-heptose 7-phosphate kinase / D-beta-D-heptose 1-phosphate adenosyltransferase